MINQQWLINGNPRGRPILGSDFKRHEEELGSLTPGQVRVRVEYLGFDPAQKGQMENISGYTSGAEVGQVMGGSGIGEVIETTVPGKIPVGSKVMGRLGWQEYATLAAAEVQILEDNDLLTAYLGPLGGTGLTAYFGLLKVGCPEPGDTVLVTGAAGAVGSIVGQIANLMDCKTIGTAGGPEKCQWLVDEVGYHHALDYKAGGLKPQLKSLCPEGINVFFDNVGGPVLNDGLSRIASFARIVICGGISRYDQETLPDGPANYFNIVFRQAKMEGFLLNGYQREYDVARSRLSDWIRSGDIVYKEDVQEGFDNIPDTLLRLFSGKNFGKQLLKM